MSIVSSSANVGKANTRKSLPFFCVQPCLFLADNIRTCARVSLTFRIDGLLSMKLCTLLLSNV